MCFNKKKELLQDKQNFKTKIKSFKQGEPITSNYFFRTLTVA
jgi:hypothetical protein